MSKRKKANILAFGKRRALGRKVDIVAGTGTTGTGTKKGVVFVDGSTSGIANGEVYLAVDTAGTGTVITP